MFMLNNNIHPDTGIFGVNVDSNFHKMNDIADIIHANKSKSTLIKSARDVYDLEEIVYNLHSAAKDYLGCNVPAIFVEDGGKYLPVHQITSVPVYDNLGYWTEDFENNIIIEGLDPDVIFEIKIDAELRMLHGIDNEGRKVPVYYIILKCEDDDE